jgi:hypothetical protein
MKPMFAWVVLLVQAAGQPPDEREKWLPPVKVVTLSRAERTVGEILKAVREQTGEEVEAGGVDEAAKATVEWKDRPVMEALHDLCRALGAGTVTVRQDPKKKPAIEIDGRAAIPAAVGHWKQFRVEVADASVTITRSLEGTKRTARLELRLVAQPGTRPLSVEGFQPEEIVDDAGWSLISSEDGALRRRRSEEPVREGEDPDAVILEDRFHERGMREDLSVSMRAPAEEAKTIERLRGRIFATFPMRFVEHSIPAAELVAGKEIRIGSLKVQVVRFTQEGGKVTFVYKMSQKGSGRDFSFIDFELRDEKGEALNRGYSGSGSDEGYTLTYTLARPVPVVSLYQKAFVGRITLAIPVDLRGIPLPKKSP